MKVRSKKFEVISIMLPVFVAVILSCGCAKVVTPVVNAGKSITIEITLKGDIDTIGTKYYMLFNNNAAPQVPFAPNEFIEPGETQTQTGDDYYAKYFPTWHRYISIVDGNALLVRPPYTSEAIPSSEVIQAWRGASPNKILINLDMDKFDPVLERLHFDLITVDRNAKIVKDNLSPLNNTVSSWYVYTISNMSASSSDETAAATSESYDISGWRIYIQ